MDLSGDGGILPFDLSSLAGLHIDGLFLRIPHIALVFHLAQEIASSGQVLKPSIAVVIAGGLCNRRVGAVIEQEGHTGDGLSVHAGNFVDQDAGNRSVIKPKRLRIIGADFDGLAAGGIVNAIPLDGFHLRYDNRSGDAAENNLAVFIGPI